tara:strand:+ start:442 stop:2259 length:1818 start_codon:yes stop_codon:yes gene_type:complete
MNIKKYSPVVYEGIPELDPESVSYQEYWEEQIHRCMNGYKPKGLDKITGKHYYYLNFYKILGNSGEEMGNRKTLIAPWYRDLDKLYFDLFEQCKQEQKGMIVIKARDKGFSYMNSALCGHEYTFYPYNEVGIAAGLQVTADSFFDKVKKGLNAQHNNFKHSVLKDTSDVIKSGYRQKNKDGKWNIGGYQSAIHCRTMSNPEVFKGERLSVMVFEEAGEFKELLNAYMSSKACFMDGDIQFGVPVIGGTGGDIETSSKDFMEMYYNADSFGLIPMFIPASVCYHGFFDIKTGISKEKEARKALIKQREKLEGRDSAKAYNLHIQNYPLTVEEAFLKTKGSRFDLSLINAQRSRIMSSSKFKNQIQRGRLEWIFDKEDGFTEAVEWIADPTGPYMVLDHPDEEYEGLDIGGIDSYDQDTAESTASMGSAIIYRRFVNTEMASDYPIAEYTERPKTAEEFWDGCLKLAIYYNAKMLIEYTKIGIIDYFKRKGALRYMKEKPKTAHAPGTLTRNRYGLQMNKQTKAVMEQYIDDYIKTNVDDIWFIDLLNELADYGTRNTDRAIAFGLCLIHNVDVHAIQAREVNEKSKKLGFVYYRKENGRLIPYKED